MQLKKISRRRATPAGPAGKNVGPDSAAGPAGIGLTKGAKALFQAHQRRGLRNNPLSLRVRTSPRYPSLAAISASKAKALERWSRSRKVLNSAKSLEEIKYATGRLYLVMATGSSPAIAMTFPNRCFAS